MKRKMVYPIYNLLIDKIHKKIIISNGGIMKDKKTDIWKEILKGANKITFLFESDKKSVYTPKDDMSALKSDWNEIGKDMQKVFYEFEEKECTR